MVDFVTGRLNEFKSYVDNIGIARNNRYEVSIDAPGIGLFMNGKSKESLYVKSVNVPTQSLMTFEHNTYGEFRTAPYQKRFDPLSITFYVDPGFDVKMLFDRWMNEVFNPDTRTSGYYDNYAKYNVLYLNIYDVDEIKTKHQVIFYEVYPKAVQEIQLDAARRDAMMLNVMLNYKYYRTFSNPFV